MTLALHAGVSKAVIPAKSEVLNTLTHGARDIYQLASYLSPHFN